ncbi:unnamed protein product [Linum trigynum]|uniref:Uncharacterized protein n=1 Tax=Linum trigynum TaxID=586398 RepID=A0AAV2CE45_9ROSI
MRGMLEGIMEGCGVADRNLADASAAVMTSFIAERRGKTTKDVRAREQPNRGVLMVGEKFASGLGASDGGGAAAAVVVIPIPVPIPIPVTTSVSSLFGRLNPTATTRTLQRQ